MLYIKIYIILNIQQLFVIMTLWYTIDIIISKLSGYFSEKERIIISNVCKKWRNTPSECDEINISKKITFNVLQRILNCTKSVRICYLAEDIAKYNITQIICALPNLYKLIVQCEMDYGNITDKITDKTLQHMSSLISLQYIDLWSCNK